jgi:hypothetical protein
MGLAESMDKNMKKNMEAQMQFQKELILWLWDEKDFGTTKNLFF